MTTCLEYVVCHNRWRNPVMRIEKDEIPCQLPLVHEHEISVISARTYLTEVTDSMHVVPRSSRLLCPQTETNRHDKIHLSCDHGSGKVGTTTRMKGIRCNKLNHMKGGCRHGQTHQMKMCTSVSHEKIFCCGSHRTYVPVLGFFVFFLWSLRTRRVDWHGPRNQEFQKKKTFSGLVVRCGSNL